MNPDATEQESTHLHTHIHSATMDYKTLLAQFKPYEAQLKAVPDCIEVLTNECIPYSADPKYQTTSMIIYFVTRSDIYHDGKDFFAIHIYHDGSWRRNDTPPEFLDILVPAFLDPAKCIDPPAAEQAAEQSQAADATVVTPPEGLKPQETQDVF